MTVLPMCQICKRYGGDQLYRRNAVGVRMCEACWDRLGDDRADRAERGSDECRQAPCAPPARRPITVSRDELQRIRRR